MAVLKYLEFPEGDLGARALRAWVFMVLERGTIEGCQGVARDCREGFVYELLLLSSDAICSLLVRARACNCKFEF